MKEHYEAPRIEVIALGTEQSILDVSLVVLTATTLPDPSNSMDMSAGADWVAWN